ncbi:MAG: zinc-ribbon domain-containing protein [Oscillospiraceae bacterium]|jgi:ribosomal protein L40E|nr:zinc-ribbon domain-containing protein [Oscillospiraceae bacterium]
MENLQSTEKKDACPFCGAKLPPSARFCGVCGKKLLLTQTEAKILFAEKTTYAKALQNDPYANPSPDPNVVYEQELRELEPYLGKKETRYYYIKRFLDMIMEGGTASWNWAAFLSPPLWFVYRRMYLYGLLFGAASLVAMFFPLLTVLMLAARVCVGVWGNYLYMNRLFDLCDTGKAMPNTMRHEHIKKYGGEAETGIILMLGAMILLYGALFVPALAFWQSH